MGKWCSPGALWIYLGDDGKERPETNIRFGQGSWNYQFWRDQTLQMYGNFEGFAPEIDVVGLVIQ